MRSVGDQVRAFREAKGWSIARMAREVRTTRQNLEHLEARPGLQPRYIDRLARAMGTTVETLLAGRYEVNAGSMSAPLSAPVVYAKGGPAMDLSPEALQLAALFDQLPTDVVLRARTWNAASTVILEALAPADGAAPRTDRPSAAPRSTSESRTKPA